MSEEGLGFRHQRVQRLRRLLRQRSAREHDGAFVVEGTKVVAAAIQAGARIEAVYHAPDAAASPGALAVLEQAHGAGVRVLELGKGVLERVADTVSPQPVLAVVSCLDVPLESLGDASAVLVLVDVRDPGNLGAIIRVADASGFQAVVACAGSGDLYNPKTVRASAGSLFSVRLVAGGDPAAALEALGRSGFRRLAAVAHDGEDYATAELSGRLALVLGNEANGLPDSLAPLFDGTLTIPVAGGADSLNVAMAAAVLCFEVARRQRADLPPGLTMWR